MTPVQIQETVRLIKQTYNKKDLPSVRADLLTLQTAGFAAAQTGDKRLTNE